MIFKKNIAFFAAAFLFLTPFASGGVLDRCELEFSGRVYGLGLRLIESRCRNACDLQLDSLIKAKGLEISANTYATYRCFRKIIRTQRTIYQGARVLVPSPHIAIDPISQASMLCGPTSLEMVFKSFGIDRINSPVNSAEQYLISTRSHGAAIAQYLCDQLALGQSDPASSYFGNGQPLCRNLLYNTATDAARSNTAAAYSAGGTWLSNLLKVSRDFNLDTVFASGLGDDELSARVAPSERVAQVKCFADKYIPVIFHIKRAGESTGHYLVANGIDYNRGKLLYVDPGDGGRKEVSFSQFALRDPNAEWRGFTGRLLGVCRAGQCPAACR